MCFSDFLNLNLSLKEISLEYGKNLGEYAVTKPIKPLEKGEELAEFIGIMLGDGNFHKNQIKISFDKRAKGYINHVKNLVKELVGIDLRELAEKGNGFRLYCCNKSLAENLISFGLKHGSKIKSQVGIPQWIKENEIFAKRCMKGLIDTDGCLIFCKRDKQIHINFTNYNERLFNDFKEVSKSLGYHFVKANRRNTRLYRKDEVAKFINDIKPFKAYGAVVQPG